MSRPTIHDRLAISAGRVRALACVLATLLCASARAQTAAPTAVPVSWTLTTSDFHKQLVTLRRIDDRGFTIVLAGTPAGASAATQGAGAADERMIRFGEFLDLTRAGASATGTVPGASRLVAVLTDGDRLAGEPVSTAGETLTWNSRALGQIPISLRRVASIERAAGGASPGTGRPAVAEPTAPAVEDVVVLANRDRLGGIVTEITAEAVTIQPDGGGVVSTVPWESVAEVRFAPIAAATSPAVTRPAVLKPTFRVSLSDGSAVSVERVIMAGDAQLHMLRAGYPERVMPLDAILGIEQVNGPVVWLSSGEPTEDVQTPFLDLSWPTRIDAAVDGGEIRAGDTVFAHGIGVHAYSRLSYSIDRGMLAFRTQYAIATAQPADAPYADVTVRIRLDGKTVYERPGVRAGAGKPLSELVQLETKGATTLTLEVDYGENFDVQDRFNWIEPALLRFVPATPAPARTIVVPTTQKSD